MFTKHTIYAVLERRNVRDLAAINRQILKLVLQQLFYPRYIKNTSDHV